MTGVGNLHRTVIIMVKEPRPGRVKTRLGRDIGLIGSAWWFRHQSRAVIRRLARDRRWRVILAVSPDREGLMSRVWPDGAIRIPQGQGDLGARMRRAFGQVSQGPVVLIGADIPGITPAMIAEAFQELGHSDVVFGPAMDGGFWLVGLRQTQVLPRGLFQDVRWSTDRTLADTLAGLNGLRVSQINRLRDVDTGDDLNRLNAQG